MNFVCDFDQEIVVLQKIYFIQKCRAWNVDSKTGLKIKNPSTDGEVMGNIKTAIKIEKSLFLTRFLKSEFKQEGLILWKALLKKIYWKLNVDKNFVV